MVKAWHMLEGDGSQFDANYSGDYSLDSLQNVVGVKQYQVSSYFFNNSLVFYSKRPTWSYVDIISYFKLLTL